MNENEINPRQNQFQQLHEDVPPEGRGPLTIEQMVQQIKETADKLIRDGANRGDVKLLTTAFKELRYCFKVFAAFRRRRKVTVFGSARLPPDTVPYQVAVEFGRRMAEAGYMVITGAASGIMEAGHVGAGRDSSIGINILLPFEQYANSVIAGDNNRLMHLKYFFTRKLLFVKESDAVVLFPGGFGTQDEGFEVLTLMQTGKCPLFPVIMLDEPGCPYWSPWLSYIRDVLLARELISPADMALFKITDSLDDAVNEILGFYRVYHGMRYVHGGLALRLQHLLPASLLQKIQIEFKDILTSGTFEQVPAFAEEANDLHVADLPRLFFHFDRKSLGRLRMLIDLLNREG